MNPFTQPYLSQFQGIKSYHSILWKYQWTDFVTTNIVILCLQPTKETTLERADFQAGWSEQPILA